MQSKLYRSTGWQYDGDIAYEVFTIGEQSCLAGPVTRKPTKWPCYGSLMKIDTSHRDFVYMIRIHLHNTLISVSPLVYITTPHMLAETRTVCFSLSIKTLCKFVTWQKVLKGWRTLLRKFKSYLRSVYHYIWIIWILSKIQFGKLWVVNGTLQILSIGKLKWRIIYIIIRGWEMYFDRKLYRIT